MIHFMTLSIRPKDGFINSAATRFLLTISDYGIDGIAWWTPWF
jgi:hypothetical protein